MLLRILAILLLIQMGGAVAQQPPSPGNLSGGWYPVGPCATASFPSTAKAQPLMVDANGNLCVSIAGMNGGTSGTPNEIAVSCAATTTQLLPASAASKFIMVQVPALNSSAGVWFNFKGDAAVTAPPSIYLSPGDSITWSPMNGFVPSSVANCIANSGTVSVSVTYK